VLLIGPGSQREPRSVPRIKSVRHIPRQTGQQQHPDDDGEDPPEHHDEPDGEQQHKRCAATAAAAPFAAHGCGT
jgi:hypothetical protein